MGAAQVDRWATARLQVRTEHADKLACVVEAMKADFPQGSDHVRAFMAEDFLVRWVLFGSCLS